MLYLVTGVENSAIITLHNDVNRIMRTKNEQGKCVHQILCIIADFERFQM
jgi:hypothetical protein